MATFFSNIGNIPDAPSQQDLSATLPKVSSNRAPPWVIKHTSLDADLGELLSWLDDEPDPRHFHIRGISLEDTRILEEEIYRVGYKPKFDWYSHSQIVVFARRGDRLLEAVRVWLMMQRPMLENELKKVARRGQPHISLFGAGEYPLEDATVAPNEQLNVSLVFEEQNPKHRRFFCNSRVVLETTFNQNVEYAEDKAWRYLHHSDGHCHVVIICDMTWPVTEPFKAVISVWTRQQTGIIDIDYPLEFTNVEHALLDHPLPATGLTSPESSVPSPTLIAKSPNSTKVEPELRIKDGLGSEKEKRIVQRSVYVLIDETAGQETGTEDQSEPLALVLNVYDFLRVCPTHQDAAPLDDELVLPLEELRNRIRRDLEFLRQEAS